MKSSSYLLLLFILSGCLGNPLGQKELADKNHTPNFRDITAPGFVPTQLFNGSENQDLNFSFIPSEDKSRVFYQIKDAPVNGTIEGCLDNTEEITCKFTPNNGFIGTELITYYAIDSFGNKSELMTLRISVFSSAPVQQKYGGVSFVGGYIDNPSAKLNAGGSDRSPLILEDNSNNNIIDNTAQGIILSTERDEL